MGSLLLVLLVRAESLTIPQRRATVHLQFQEKWHDFTEGAARSAGFVREQGCTLLNRAGAALDEAGFDLVALQTSCMSASRRVDVALQQPRHAAGAALSSCVCLAKAIPKAQSAGDADEACKAWMGLAGGILCGGASVVAATACTGLALAELAAQLGKSLACRLATGLATGASFGCAAPHLRAQLAEAAAAAQRREQLLLQQHEDEFASDHEQAHIEQPGEKDGDSMDPDIAGATPSTSGGAGGDDDEEQQEEHEREKQQNSDGRSDGASRYTVRSMFCA